MKTDNTGTVSYNESQARHVKLRHIFFPGTYGFVSEMVVALLALILFNASQFSNQWVGEDLGANPFSLWYRPLRQIIDSLDRYYITQRVTLFVLWAVVGLLIYILIFRLFQVLFSIKDSMETGVELVREDPRRGLVRWLASLHDFFVIALAALVGLIAVGAGTLVCFSIASQELRNGLTGSFPGDIVPLLLSLVGALISVRLIVLGISLLSRRFRSWYTV